MNLILKVKEILEWISLTYRKKQLILRSGVRKTLKTFKGHCGKQVHLNDAI